MTALLLFQPDFDRATRRIFVNVDVDAGYAILGDRNAYESAGTRRLWNWVGSGNWLPGYRDYYGRATGTDADSYATTMRTGYPILWEFRSNAIVLDVQGTPIRDQRRPRYDMGLFDTLSYGRDSWAADFRSYTQTFLASH